MSDGVLFSEIRRILLVHVQMHELMMWLRAHLYVRDVDGERELQRLVIRADHEDEVWLYAAESKTIARNFVLRNECVACQKVFKVDSHHIVRGKRLMHADKKRQRHCEACRETYVPPPDPPPGTEKPWEALWHYIERCPAARVVCDPNANCRRQLLLVG